MVDGLKGDANDLGKKRTERTASRILKDSFVLIAAVSVVAKLSLCFKTTCKQDVTHRHKLSLESFQE